MRHALPALRSLQYGPASYLFILQLLNAHCFPRLPIMSEGPSSAIPYIVVDLAPYLWRGPKYCYICSPAGASSARQRESSPSAIDEGFLSSPWGLKVIETTTRDACAVFAARQSRLWKPSRIYCHASALPSSRGKAADEWQVASPSHTHHIHQYPTRVHTEDLIDSTKTAGCRIDAMHAVMSTC